MKIIKFAQSCVMIETKGKKILVDPGTLSSEEEFEKMKEPDYVFITHKHGDHFNENAFNKIKKEETKIYSTQEVASAFPKTNFEILKEEDNFEIDDIKLEVVKAVHGYMPFLKKKNAEIEENVGYIFEIEGKKIYHTSDTICFKNNYECDILFVPVCNHGLVMGAFEAALFAKETEAGLVVPMHYDNPKYPANLEKVKKEFDKAEINYKILGIEESFEI
jgi:L-ascorbate metabolism protein UlaG (beta-lactamase superfamily)